MSLPRVDVAVTQSTVVVSCAGEPLCEPYRLEIVELRARLGTAGDDVAAHGAALFDALLRPAWGEITQLDQVRAARGVELALRLPEGLQPFRWESMHDGRQPLAATDLLVAFTRTLPANREPRPAAGALRVLFASGTLFTDPVIRPGAMFLGLARECESGGLAITRLDDGVTLDRLAQRYATFRPDLVHLVAHGRLDERGEPMIQLAGQDVSAAQLVDALRPEPPLAVVLSSCHSAADGRITAGGPERTSSIARALIAAGVPLVAAMAGEISEQACRMFSRLMTRSLLAGQEVAEAVAHGRRAALLAGPVARDRFDWAMPVLYAAQTVPAGFRAVDPGPAQRVRELARRLDLLQQPVYIGRRPIFDAVDELFARKTSFVVAASRSGLENLGSTRLLRQLGFRLLQEGHVPLPLLPYKEESAPTSLREVVTEMMHADFRVRRGLGLPFRVPLILGGEQPPDSALARQRLRSDISAFRKSTGELSPDSVGELLAEDLGALAMAARELGPPFGEHTRTVVLAEALHLWKGALGWTEDAPGLLELLNPDGLGSPSSPVPVIATASMSESAALRAFQADRPGIGGCVFPELGPLPDEEAALGYQWILLHPWHPDVDFRKVYVAAPDHDQDKLRERFRKRLKGEPKWIPLKLYEMVDDLAAYGHFRIEDDDHAWQAYAKLHGLKQDL
ncbi:CHAT domain-containing protein [Acrocarpospora catenulata]|uniref:CHAT domain-containing protein n=1 Tax=Acrocarpospora catenulata TaxID=2836182 RepID=UPI001BD96989|nr:CHAT domain-containing protein [Acrocarpospora catenulata]